MLKVIDFVIFMLAGCWKVLLFLVSCIDHENNHHNAGSDGYGGHYDHISGDMDTVKRADGYYSDDQFPSPLAKDKRI